MHGEKKESLQYTQTKEEANNNFLLLAYAQVPHEPDREQGKNPIRYTSNNSRRNGELDTKIGVETCASTPTKPGPIVGYRNALIG